MTIHLEKHLDPKNQHRWYDLTVMPNLFGEWSLIREWGRVGNDGGHIMTEWHETKDQATKSQKSWERKKRSRGYA